MPLIFTPGFPATPTFTSETVTGLATFTGGVSIPSTPAPAACRGIRVLLGTSAAINLNSVAATTIFTTPASGFTKCVVTEVFGRNFTGGATTNAVSFGASATPTDWLGATVLPATTASTNHVLLEPAIDIAAADYGTAIAFVVNVTAGGAAITGIFDVWGYYI